jgi:hypothetical protein
MIPMSLEDKAMSIESVTSQSTGRKAVGHLYQALLECSHGSPTLRGATSLFKAIGNGGTVVIASGFMIKSVGKCETDGPIGSVVLARLLNRMANHVILLTDPQNLTLFEKLGRVACLDSFRCVGFPIDSELAERHAEKLLREFAPVAVIGIERPGWNLKSIYHNMLGEDISDKTAKVDYLFNKARENNISTFGIGDGGNEIGMGNILHAVIKYVPFGSVCRCPCGGGIASITKTDHLVASSVSNWGAYGLTALLALLAGVSFDHDPADEYSLVKTAIEAGAVDGTTGKPTFTVDGLSIDRNMEVVSRISSLVRG